MEIKKVTLIGGGVLGSQIAYQSAYCGFDVTVYMRSEASIGRTKPKMEMWHGAYVSELEADKALCGNENAVYSHGLIKDIKTITPAEIDGLIKNADDALNNMKYETDLAKALEGADLVIEAMAEDKEQKIEMYQKMQPLFDEKTIVCSNSSTMLPSTFVEYTGKGEKFLNLHFANSIWMFNTAEVMGHSDTDEGAYNTVVEFAKAINMVPLCLHKEQPGYILNSMLVPFLSSAQMLWAKEVADPHTIDLTWELATGAPSGPFKIIDVVGLNTVYNIEMANPESKDPSSWHYKLANMIKEKIEKGETGRNAGKGFYDYK
ncbi:MAG: 3-hydroxyacyl-CoA dehydrogenase [Eubacterium sp.]|nr:3-hydroxyacyl-CoA dehydrogenase [Eubacterium sp.]